MKDEFCRSKEVKSVVPSYGPGNSLYSATYCLTGEDIHNYFRIISNRSNSSLSRTENSSKRNVPLMRNQLNIFVQHHLNNNRNKIKNYIEINSIEFSQPHFIQSLFSFSFFLLFSFPENNIYPSIKKLLQKIFKKNPIKNSSKYISENRSHWMIIRMNISYWNKGIQLEIDSETTVNISRKEFYSNGTENSSSMNQRFSQFNLIRGKRKESDDHLSDIEGQTDPDGQQSEGDQEEIRQIFGVSHAL